jgi:hypothetical protein
MTDDATSTFQKNLRGQLIQPADPQYDEARALYHDGASHCCLDRAFPWDHAPRDLRN